MGLLDAFTADYSGTGPDLSTWAAERGLTFAGEAEVFEGIALNPRGDLISNVCVGKLGGSEMGVVIHDHLTASGVDSGPHAEHYTRIATRVPEALSPIQSFVLTNGPRLGQIADDFKMTPEFQQLDASNYGLGTGGWVIAMPLGVAGDMLTRLFRGAMGDALQAYPKFAGLDYRYGTLTFVHDDEFLPPGPELDAAVELLCTCARELRREALAAASPQPFDTPLPEPEWVNAAPPQAPAEKKWGPFKVVQAAGGGVSMKDRLDPFAKGGAYEDTAAYHAAFPSNPAPGIAWATWRKQTPAGQTIRLAINTEGRLDRGPCVALMAVNAEDHPAPIATQPGAMGVAVSGGLMAAWMYRDQSNYALVDTVETQAIEVATQQGWLS